MIARLVLATLLLVVALPARASHVDDALHRKIEAELSSFVDWLSTFEAPGYVGETGWPDDYAGDADEWNALAQDWLEIADEANLGAVVWATGEWWGDYKLAVYENADDTGGVETANTQAPVLEAHLSTPEYRRGINVSTGTFCEGHGLEPTSSFSNHDTGRYGTCYIYDGQETFDYIAGRGLDTVKVEFRWEIVQRSLGGPLHDRSMRRLRAVVDRAHAAGLHVILSMHNFGAYWLWNGEEGVRRAIGSGKVPIKHFTNVWKRLSRSFAGESELSFAIMSEPVGLPSKDGMSPAELWEKASQRVVEAIRAVGDDRPLLVNGYRWSSLADWADIHPDPWISDPADNFFYTAHHYWDADGSGSYEMPYADEVAAAE